MARDRRRDAPGGAPVPYAATTVHRLPPVAPPSQTQLAWRGRIEALIRVVRPGLDLILLAGERVSRAVEREDLDWAPPRPVSAPRPPAQVSAGPRDPEGPR